MKTQNELIQELNEILKGLPSEEGRRAMILVVELSEVKAERLFELWKMCNITNS